MADSGKRCDLPLELLAILAEDQFLLFQDLSDTLEYILFTPLNWAFRLMGGMFIFVICPFGKGLWIK